jgi:hypothetical protein
VRRSRHRYATRSVARKMAKTRDCRRTAATANRASSVERA